MSSPKVVTRGQEVATDVAALLRARSPLLWVVTREEARVEALLFEAAAAAGYFPCTWDVAAGFREMGGKEFGDAEDPGEAIKYIDSFKSERRVWIMRDLPPWLSGPAGIATNRALRNLARSLPARIRDQAQAVIVLSPSGDVPPELANHTVVLEWPMPDREEIGAILDAAVASGGSQIEPLNGNRDKAIDAAIGLTGEEAQACFAKSLVQLRKIDPVVVAQEKKRVVAREGVLEWFDPLPGGLAAVGGLELLKQWLIGRASAYSQRAREYGLPAPKGAFFGGIPGCGKSLTAKAIATAWGVPLLKVDLGALKSKFVGESEQNLRKAFKVIEAIGRCVVWFDEIEKALPQGAAGSSDGGVSADALGAVLNWMQERKGEAFVIATANDVESLPPELLRKGRFDEVWWIDLPTEAERVSILAAALRTHGRGKLLDRNETDFPIDLTDVATVTKGFTGSEVAALVPDAMFAAFADNEREIKVSDLITAARGVTPLSKTADQKIERLQKWGKDRARPASIPEVAKAGPAVRQLDI